MKMNATNCSRHCDDLLACLTIAGCDALMSSDDDDVIKIASAHGGVDATTRRATEVFSPSPARSDRLQLTDWTRRVTASAPLLPSDVVVCIGTCRNGGYQTTTTTTTGTSFPPPSYAESICNCTAQAESSLTCCHRHLPQSTACNDFLTSHAAQLNYYTNRT